MLQEILFYLPQMKILVFLELPFHNYEIYLRHFRSARRRAAFAASLFKQTGFPHSSQYSDPHEGKFR